MEATFDNRTNLLAANVRSFVDSSVLYTITTTHNLWGRTVTLLKDANPALGTHSPIVGAIYWRERLFEVNGHRKSISDVKRKPPGFVAARDPTSRVRKHKKHRSGSRARAHDSSGARTSGKDKASSKSRPKGQQQQHKTNQAPGCTGCLGRRSPVLSIQIGLGDWWRSVTCNTRYWRWSADRTEYELVYRHEQWKVSVISPLDQFLFHFFKTKALVHSEDDDDEKSSRTVSARHPPPLRTRSTVSYAACDATADGPRFSATATATATAAVTTVHKQPIGRSTAFFSIASLVRFSQDDEDKQDDEKKYRYEEEQELDAEKAKEERRRTRASLFIPYRHHLFHKNKPAVLKMESKALLQDEVFLLLVLIYSETKRQDRTVSSFFFFLKKKWVVFFSDWVVIEQLWWMVIQRFSWDMRAFFFVFLFFVCNTGGCVKVFLGHADLFFCFLGLI